MRRTNVILDEEVLEQAVRLSGERTYSATINRALDEMVRRIKVKSGLEILGGSNAWEGDLAEMRGDNPRVPDDEWWPEVERQLSMIRDAPPARRKRSSKRSRGSR